MKTILTIAQIVCILLLVAAIVIGHNPIGIVISFSEATILKQLTKQS